MHGRRAQRVVKGLVLVFLAAGLGCGGARPQTSAADPPPSEANSEFDPAAAGTVSGRVRWAGELPSVPPLVVAANPGGPPFLREKTTRPNPNAPAIDATTRGVRDAVVFLRGVDPRRARPWDHPPVRVVQQGEQFHVSGPGFVRRGDAVEMVSADPVFHALHAGGAAFFSLPFPDANRPRTRRLAERGVVELTSGAGYYWMRAYLFVDDHPYYARTDAEGHFVLRDVPPGSYEVVCWLPDWREQRHERDPETSLVTRLYFRPPLETVRRVTVAPKGLTSLDFELSAP